MAKVPGVNHVELKGPMGREALTIDGHLLPCTSVAISLDAGSIPEVTVKLPVYDGMVFSLDTRVKVGGETREALIAMGWTPPPDDTGPKSFEPTSAVVARTGLSTEAP